MTLICYLKTLKEFERFPCSKNLRVPHIFSLLLCRGLASILELHVKLVSLVLDIISRPMWWGISMDLGSKLPFSHAYFPCKNQILKILTGPLSFKSLEYLVHEVYKPVNTFSNKIVNIDRINHSSIW